MKDSTTEDISNSSNEQKNHYIKTLWSVFKDNFLNYFWIGLLLIILSMYLSSLVEHKDLLLILKIIETVGIAIFVAGLFSFTFETVSFQSKMQDIVEKIVLKRAFLSELPIDKKKESLHNLLKPTESEIEKYSNIEDFYNSYIEEILKVSQRNVRSNYNINIKVKYDIDKKKVFSEGLYSYRLYPSNSGYTDIIVGFLKEDSQSSVDVILNMPDGKRKTFSFDELKERFKETELTKETRIKVNDLCKDFHHVDVELRVKEYGFNHWMNVFFKAEQATDGFKMTIMSDGDLTIKSKVIVFDVGHNYHVDYTSDNEVHVSCHQWLNEGSGVSLIVSKPECSN
ncbi:hypothetical protein ACOL29_04070 [Aliarcobacter butzleri]